jgi:hypothetical protein
LGDAEHGGEWEDLGNLDAFQRRPQRGRLRASLTAHAVP